MTKRTSKTIETHEFTLYLRGFDVLQDEVLEHLYEAGFDDGTFVEQNGIQRVSLHREGPSFPEAVMDAIRRLEKEVPGLLVVGVDGDELVSAAEIAERTGRTRESVRLLIEGKRGPGGFPPALPWVNAGKTRLYEWAEVERWLRESLGEKVPESPHARFVSALNGALAVRYRAAELDEATEREAVAAIIREDADLLAPS